MKRIYDSKAFWICASLLMSLVFWIYVTSVEGDEHTETFYGVRVEIVGEDYLRDVNEKEFLKKIATLREDCGDRAVIRAMHFFADNALVVEEKAALMNNRFDDFLSMIKSSGNSSFRYLQNVFSVSAPTEQGLSLALALTEKFLGNRGGCRVHGGGFAGTIQAFIPEDMLEDYKNLIESVFGEDSCYVLNIRSVGGYALSVK